MAITSNPTIQQGAVSVGTGTKSFLNIAANTAVKSSAGRVCTVNVIVAGSAAGAVYDHATTSGLVVANLVALIPEAVGTYKIDFPCATGIAIQPPTGGKVTVSYN
jgi:hypothetical protein